MAQWEGLEKRPSRQDEGPPQEKGAQDPPEQYAMLEGRGTLKAEKITMKTKRLSMDGLSRPRIREELQPLLRSEHHGEARAECESQADPDPGPEERLAGPDGMILAVEDTHVEGEHREDENEESGPEGPDSRSSSIPWHVHRLSPSRG